MANKAISIKVKIYPDILRSMIEKRSSMRKIGELGICSDKTIRRGLCANELTIDAVVSLAKYLEVSPDEFSDIDGYFVRLKEFIYDKGEGQ